MTVDEPVSFNVRIVNNGGSTVSSRAAKRIRLFYHWIAPNGGREVGLRTDFLIDIPPGRGLTMPIRVRAPKLPGRYRLEIMPVMEFLWWRRLSWSKRRPIYWAAISADIEVHRDTTPVKAPPWVETDNVLTYADDHCRAFDLLRSWMVRFLPEGEHTIVEVGGNFYPMVESLPGAVYNVDIDPFGLMTRNILRRGQDRFVNVVADGLNLPFADKSVDLITLFATFHHFPDPVGLLRHLAKKIKPSGLICLMCEPVGQAFVETLAPEFLRELEHGAYEQAFTRWEYTAMIDAAGLEVVAGVLDRGSAKIALRPRSKYQVFAASPAQTPRVKDQRGDQTTLETDLLAKDETLETPYASAPGRITAPLRSRNQMPSGLEGGTAAWLRLKPGSRPRGLARRSVLKAVQFCRARPALARLARYLLRSSPTLEARVKRTIICGRADRTDMPQNASNVRNNQ
jgi:SAM-dependent methyltransferase